VKKYSSYYEWIKEKRVVLIKAYSAVKKALQDPNLQNALAKTRSGFKTTLGNVKEGVARG